MASTPSPRARRARTPPTPVHGAAFDSYEPYSPRRSKRNTAQNNPYGSFNSDRSSNLTPPTTVKTTRFARNPTHLSSPPSSPISPVRHRVHKTPRKPHSRGGQSAGHSDSDQASTSLAPDPTTSTAMLPTPLKTPKKRNNAAISSTARILNFQPNDPNDIMPVPRKLKQHSRMRSSSGFELYDDDASKSSSIPIFTDTNARVPEMDDADDNPFVGPKTTTRATRSSGRNHEADRVDDMIRKDEGVVYVFRGKKVFRRFDDGHGDRDGSPSSSDSFGSITDQRRLKRQIGAAAQRPLTCSTVKPRLLFPSEEQLREREMRANEVDEEAVTDIEMSNTSPIKKEPTPRRKKGAPATPPTTLRTTRFTDKMDQAQDPDNMAITPTAGSSNSIRNKTQSPFDAWPRTKGGRKRAGGAVEVFNAGKRTRSGVIHSPA